MIKRVLMILAVVGVFGAILAWMTFHLRGEIRQRMLEQEGASLQAVARFQALGNGHESLDLVLGMVELEGVIGVRIFGADGEGVAALPRSLTSGRLPGPVLEQLRGGHPVTRLESQVWLGTEFADPFGVLTEQPVPLLRVFVSLGPSGPLVTPNFAEFLFDGLPLARALTRLDRQLFFQFLVAFSLGSGLILLIVGLSFYSIDRKSRELAEANRELTMQAKTSAVGAVSAHLFHALRNALAGIRLDAADNGAAAAESARSMQHMIQEIVDILQEDAGSLDYTLSSGEILEMVAVRMERPAGDRGVGIETRGSADAIFSNREGNLIILILENLVRNAIDASSSGGRVWVEHREERDARIFVVRDSGAGIPQEIRARLFHPVRSGKPGGTGIGLSISRHLARQLGADLELVHSGPNGTEFALRLPEKPGTV